MDNQYKIEVIPYERGEEIKISVNTYFKLGLSHEARYEDIISCKESLLKNINDSIDIQLSNIITGHLRNK